MLKKDQLILKNAILGTVDVSIDAHDFRGDGSFASAFFECVFTNEDEDLSPDASAVCEAMYAELVEEWRSLITVLADKGAGVPIPANAAGRRQYLDIRREVDNAFRSPCFECNG